MLAAALPDLDSLDLQAIKALVIAQHEQYTRTLSSRATEIERLLLLVEKLKHMLFGRKSEKVLRQIEQLQLQIEDLEVATAAEEIQAVPHEERRAPAKPFRRPLPEHLPREIHTHMPAHEACPDCGGRLRGLGEDVAEMLEYVRASFKVLRHVRPKLSCDACDRIVQAPAPSRDPPPIEWTQQLGWELSEECLMSSGQRRIFPEAFKREAVARVSTSGLPPSKVALELGLHETVLRRWMRQFTVSSGTAPTAQQRAQPVSPSVADLAAENSRLRRENDRLRMEREILKKTVTIFGVAAK